MKYGIVAFPSKKLQDLANTYRKRYDPHYAKITPHITLKDSFDATEEDIQSVVKQLDGLAAKFAPLNIHASRISSFFPTTNAIYFRIEPTEQLTALYQALEEVPFGESKHVFVPHITIAQKMTDSEHDDIFGQLRMTGVDEKDSIDRIHLLYQLEDGSWTTYETFRLTGAE
ncbi:MULTISPECIES: YjcG family protein [unclassified Lysinibacillus]|uniref:YjcG family protein n=1 Tax=unclassified Lysinibacillus TaxID=2636778 RepID=UPI002010E305|nr:MULTISPECIES: YjcG family protein [unclassified Lysinibacillus]MCL1695748.1 YjcG family protein [Lysinibacillus sp. BPa_S21]MCL1700010.1 YjcG family protein [Lysinibacillus sp. Bpr_S20]